MRNLTLFRTTTRLLFCTICLLFLVPSLTSAQSAEEYLKEAYKAPHNSKEQFNLYMKAAELGNHTAQLCIGNHYYFGWVVEKNTAQGCKWYKMAAEGGNTEAMIRLGWCYHIGDGVQKDDSQAE